MKEFIYSLFESKKQIMKYKFLIFLLLGLIIGFIFGRQTTRTNNLFQNIKQTQKDNTPDEVCISEIELADLNKDELPDYLINCRNKIKVIISPYSDDFNGIAIEDDVSFPDLFYFPGYEDNSILRKVMVFPKNKPKFILVKSIEYTGGSYLEAFGIYKLNNGKVERIFKKGFAELKGRGVSIEPSDFRDEFRITVSRISDYSTGDWETTIEDYTFDNSINSFKLARENIIK